MRLKQREAPRIRVVTFGADGTPWVQVSGLGGFSVVPHESHESCGRTANNIARSAFPFGVLHRATIRRLRREIPVAIAEARTHG